MKYKLLLLFLCLTLFVFKRMLNLSFLYFPLLILIVLLTCELFYSYLYHIIKTLLLKNKNLNKRSSVLFLILLVFTWFTLFSFKSTGQFNSFHSRMYDLGNMDQAIWNTSKGRLLESTTLIYPFSNRSRLSGHLEPVYLLLACIYRIKADPRILLVFQTALISIAIIAVYILSMYLMGNRLKALAIAAVFSLFPALQFMTLFDFHGDVLSIPFLIFSYYFYLSEKKAWYYLFIIAALSCKEYVALSVAGYGISLIFMHKDIKHGIITSVLGTGYFLAAVFFIIPFFNQGNEPILISLNYSHIGGNEGLGGILSYALKNPSQFIKSILTLNSLENLFYLLFPLFFIPLRFWGFLWGAAPVILKDLMAGLDIYNHRLAPAIPFLFIALVYSLREDWNLIFLSRPIKRNYLLTLVLISTLLASYTYGPSPLGHRFWRERDRYFKDEHSKTCSTVIKQIPSDAVISVSRHLAPHLTHRRFCYVFPNPSTAFCKNLRNVQFICIDTLDAVSCFWDDTSFAAQTIPQIYSLGFELITKDKSVFLFKRKK